MPQVTDGAAWQHSSRAFSRYSEIALLSPTVIASTYSLFDAPQLTTRWAIVAFGIILLSLQQVTWLVSSEVWPAAKRDVPRVLTSTPALVLGALAAQGILAYGLSEGRPTFIWALPSAVAVAFMMLAWARWDGERPRWKSGALVVVGVIVAAAAVLAEWINRGRPGEVMIGDDAGITILLTAVATVALVGQVWWDRVVSELSAAREQLVSHAITEERLRFAGELHDVQGQELQVIALRADLARSLLAVKGVDGLDQARDMIEEIAQQARDALRQTREIALGYRQVGLREEVDNARKILAAAGITTTLEGSTEAFTGPPEHLAGMVVREATTNILRHSLADALQITIRSHKSGPTLLISDSGPPRDQPRFGMAPGSGLDSLDERARAVGYSVDARGDGAGWMVHLLPTEGEEGP